MEKLSLYIQELVDEGAWQPISISKDGPAISHPFLVYFAKPKSLSFVCFLPC